MTAPLVDLAVLRAACPERSDAQLAEWIAPINKACARFEINTIRRVAAFIAQMAHESGLQPAREENLNYSAQRLAQVWPKRFSDGKGQPNRRAQELAHQPEMLANVVYANRLGNGPPESGDGWRFRGVGPLQLTGRASHWEFAQDMGMPANAALEAYLRTIEGGVMSAAWFWEANDINRLADTPGVSDETRRINGGDIGLADRKARFDRTVAALLKAERTT